MRQERDSRARFIVLEPKREQFSKLLKGAASVYDAMAGLLGSMMYELEDRAGASSHHRSVLLTPGAFDAPGVSDDEFKIVDFETLGLMRLVADITAKIKANIPALFSKDVHAHFMEASATMRALDDLISLLITKIETLYPDIGIAEKCLDKRGKFRSRLKDELDRQAQIVSSSST
ncbi:hypothetical protein C0J09_11590 [Bordetella avium]|nr:hypothetical protein C0J09_11590 [Bordetella avium]